MTYLVGLSVENYWQALPTLPGQAQREAFLPKPFVNDGADLGRLQQIATRPDFLIALILCLSVQTVQANGLRARKGTIVKSGDGRSFGLLKSKAKGSLGLLMLTLYGIDIYTGWVNFPLIGVAAAVVPINAFWLLLSIFGAELVGNAIICMLEEIKSDE